MVDVRPFSEIKPRSPEAMLSDILQQGTNGREAGRVLLSEARSFGLDPRDYLLMACKPQLSENPNRYAGLNGYEAALSFMNLPVKNDFENGVTLQAASQTFQTFDGTRFIFPQVVDDMMRWAVRWDSLEVVAPIISNSRTINGPELLTAVILDPENDRDNYRTSAVSELGRIPIRTIRMEQNAVKIWKHGSGYKTSYEFTRRAAIDMLTPFAARVQRELDRSKVVTATNILINGDGVYAAAGIKKQSDFDGTQSGKLEYKPLLKWLVSRAKAGTPIDTVLGNFDMYIEWLMMFAAPAVQKVAAGEALDPQTAAQRLQSMGVGIQAQLPVLNFNVNFALSSSVPDGQLVGFTKSETLEELVEANSMIAESEQSIINQSITYVKTQNTGYKLAFGDTREIYDCKTP